MLSDFKSCIYEHTHIKFTHKTIWSFPFFARIYVSKCVVWLILIGIIGKISYTLIQYYMAMLIAIPQNKGILTL